MRKFQPPKDKIAMWQGQLQEVKAQQREVAEQKIIINNEMIGLQLRAHAGEELGTELSACKRKEMHVRMAELVLAKQKEALEKAISG